MSDEELKLVLITALKYLLTKASTPILSPLTSLDLLSRVMTVPIPSGLLPHSSPPKFRLTDLGTFERMLEELSATWEDGWIVLSKPGGEDAAANNKMMIYELGLGPGRYKMRLSLSASGSGSENAGAIKKRKRVVDEDADSAAGDVDEEEELLASGQVVQVGIHDSGALAFGTGSTLANLSPEMREVYTFIQKGTAKGKLLAERFRSHEEHFEPICSFITRDECAKARRSQNNVSTICDRVHFRPLIRPHTDTSLGHCSYLNTCYSEPTYAQSPSIPPPPSAQYTHGHSYAGMALPNSRGAMSLPSGLGAGGRGKEKAPCRYLHYEVDWDPPPTGWEMEWKREMEKLEKERKYKKEREHRLQIGMGPMGREVRSLPPQWMNCDLRTFDYSVLGKFHVIMADPPWDIHMSLPYGTMKDDEMRAMPIPLLQDEGFLFLWVTGRAMEVGRECLEVWGYQRVDEVVWVKTNQLQRVIRTGRTGHWLNHTKEHMLVGVKRVLDSSGKLKFPSWANRGVDTDVIVSEVRETSRKPDEVYGIIERLCPGGRKVEIFGRKHNTRPGWLTLGNQLGSDQIYEEDLALRIKAKYPERQINLPTPYRTSDLALP